MSDRFEDQMEENASLLQRIAPSPITRRRVLLGGGVGAVALVAAACGTEEEEDPAATGDPTTSTTSTTEGDEPAADGSGDVAIAMAAASLEVLAVNTYGAVLQAATAGDLGEVPPAVAEYATVAMEHHQAHLDGWNELLTSLGESEVSEPPPELETMVNEQFAEVTDITGVAELALMLEQTAADTYFAVIPTLTNPQAVELAATIQPIDMQHSAILRYVMGDYPVPNTFANTENAIAV